MYIGSDNGLTPIQRHAIIETNPVLLSIGYVGKSFNEILVKIRSFSFKKNAFDNVVCAMTAFCPGWGGMGY